MMQGVQNRISFKFIFTNPGLKHSGVFYLYKGKIMTIDYTKLNDQIVRQAFDATSAFLTQAQRQKLFQNKIDRAEQMIQARASVYYQTDK
jgi:hypothetical protein